MSEPLGRVLDPEALAESGGERGRYRIEVPPGWADCGDEIDLSIPARLACARCDGGGCDGCHRSGVVRGPDDAAMRTIRIRLPPRVGEGVALRITRPFGDSSTIEQLILEITPGACASAGVVLVRRPGTSGHNRARSLDRLHKFIWPAVAIAIAIGLLLASQR